MSDLPKIVRQRLAQSPQPEVHPDADLLTAYIERNLSDVERGPVIAHLAECSICRDVVALATPTAPIETLPEPAPARRWWPALRWTPVFAAVIVVAAAVVWRAGDVPAPFAERQVATATKPAEQPARSNEAEVAENRPATPAAPAVSRGRADAQLARAESKLKKEQGFVDSRAKDTTQTADEIAQVAPAAPPTPRPSPSAPAAAPAGNVVAGQLGSRETQMAKSRPAAAAERDQVADAAPPSPAATSPVVAQTEQSGTGIGAGTGGGVGTARRTTPAAAAGFGAVALSKAQAAPRAWRIHESKVQVRSGAPEWRDVPVASDVQFLVVTEGPAGVWAAGRAGALFHLEPAGWQRVTIPGLEGDITAISFVDAQHGVIATSAAHWATADGGKTWQRQ